MSATPAPATPLPAAATAAPAEHCLNCDAPVAGRYCSNCGQRNVGSRMSLWGFLVETLGDYFHVDSKLFRSFGLLLARPGELTRRHLAGRRQSFIKPFKMYLTASVLFFSYNALHAKPNVVNVGKDGDATFQLGFTAEKPRPPDAKDSLAAPQLGANANILIDDGKPGSGPSAGRGKIPDDMPGRSILLHIIDNARRDPAKLGAAASHAMTAWTPRIMFVLVPAFALILKALHGRKRFFVEHFVFALHLHAFVFLVFLAQAFVDSAWFSLPTWLLLFVYLFVAWRKVYPEALWKTVLKGGVLVGTYLVLVLLSLAGVVLTALYYA